MKFKTPLESSTMKFEPDRMYNCHFQAVADLGRPGRYKRRPTLWQGYDVGGRPACAVHCTLDRPRRTTLARARHELIHGLFRHGG